MQSKCENIISWNDKSFLLFANLKSKKVYSILCYKSFKNFTNWALNVKTRRRCGEMGMQIGCWQIGCGNCTERLFPLCNLYLVSFLSLHGLLPLRALIDDHHSNLLVVFPGLTLLWLRVIAIGHLSQKHPLWLAIWQQRGRFRKAGMPSRMI